MRANLIQDILDGIKGHEVRTRYMNGHLLSIRTASVFILVMATGCGYTLQSTKTNSLKDDGIEKVYVAPVKNLTYKPGVENVIFNELTQVLLAGKRVAVVDNIEMADAVLESSVTNAAYVSTASTSASEIFPKNVPGIDGFNVATEYQATVACQFSLVRRKAGRANTAVWSTNFSRSRRFAGNNQKVAYGTTSALINESEFDRAIRETAHGMMLDLHESLVSRF